MELKYIWIEDYKNLKKIGLNFNHSGNDNFEFKNGELKIFETNIKTPKDFFSDSILGVTGIVGKNGSGKTNLAEFINYNLAHVTDTALSFSEANNKGIIVLGKWMFIHKSFEIKNKQELLDKGFKINYYEKAPFDLGRGDAIWDSMEKNRYIYYNPSFDFRPIPNGGNLSNISTGYLLYNDLYKSTRHFTEDGQSRNKTDSLDAHYINEKIRESNFILSYPDEIERLVGQTPINITISIDHYKNNRLLNTSHESPEEIKKYPKKKLKHQNQIDLNQLEREILSLLNLAQYKVDKPEITGYDVYEIPIDYQKTQFKKIFFIQLFNILLIDIDFPSKVFEKFIFSNTINSIDESLSISINKLSEFLDELIEFGRWGIKKDKLRQEYYYGEIDASEINIHNLFKNLKISLDTEKKKSILNEIISITNKITKNRLHFHYSFYHEMSSGQNNLISFFSRLLWAKQNIESRENTIGATKSERIILFIDEGELTFHPEWQRRYFKEVISFLKKIFTNRKVQLLISTHSPFVLSDLPKQNVIFLEKDVKGNAVISTLIKENTFGANIHDLLSSSFFMESTMGEFASDRIKEIVNFYYKVIGGKSDKIIKNLHEEYIFKREKFHFVVDSIGDDVIKGILENHIEFIENNLLGESYEKNRIAKLEKELKKLRKTNDKDSLSK